jgi:hypothetical protein
LNIIQAMMAPEIFGQWFAGDTWQPWRTVIAAAFGLPLTPGELTFFKSVAGGRDPPTKQVKEVWALVGRRAGKDSIASIIATFAAAMFDPKQANLRPGERATIACLAVDRFQAAIVHGYIVGYFREIPALAAMINKEMKDGLELTNGVDILVVTSNYRAARGKSYQIIIFDEVAYWRDEETSVNPDKEIYRGMRPGMASLPDSMLIGITSTYKRSGLAYDRFANYHGKNSDRYLVVHAPSQTFNPSLDQQEIDAAMADDPVAARADYFSEWRDDLAGYIPRQLIESAVDPVPVRPCKSGINYLAFEDGSEGVSPTGDSYAAAIAHRAGDDLILDWRSSIARHSIPAPSSNKYLMF